MDDKRSQVFQPSRFASATNLVDSLIKGMLIFRIITVENTDSQQKRILGTTVERWESKSPLSRLALTSGPAPRGEARGPAPPQSPSLLF